MINQHVQTLYQMAKARFERELDQSLLSEWLCKHTRLKGKPFSLDRYPFQRALIDETHPRAVTVKPSQVGVSELYQRVALGMLARTPYRKGIYSYPDDLMRKKNVQTRVQPLYDGTQAFHQDRPEAVSSIELMQLGDSFLYMTGSKVGDATSTDADFVFLDEYDLHDMAIASLFSSRLQNSDWKIERYFSTPTYTGFGVSALWDISDQLMYLIKCGSCNHWQFPMFEERWLYLPRFPSDVGDLKLIDQEMIDRHRIGVAESYVCCEKCRARLDLGREDNRAWVAKHPDRTGMRGRKINMFSVATRPPADIISELLKYKLNDAMKGFNNSVLGEPIDGGANRLSEADVRACMNDPEVPKIDTSMPTFVGLDMGHTCHLIVGQGDSVKDIKVVLVEKVPLANIRQRIKDIDNTYNLIGGCVDRHPESQIAKDLWDITEGKIVPAEYRGSQEINAKILLGTEDKVEYIQVDRTTLLDEAARAIRGKYVQFNGFGMLVGEIIQQFRNMAREELPETPAVWIKLDKNDHTFHSLGFLITAMKLKGYTEAKYGIPQSLLGLAVADMPGSYAVLPGQQAPRRDQEQFASLLM